MTGEEYRAAFSACNYDAFHTRFWPSVVNAQWTINGADWYPCVALDDDAGPGQTRIITRNQTYLTVNDRDLRRNNPKKQTFTQPLSAVKYVRFRDIKPFTDIGHYSVDYPLNHFKKFIEDEVNTMGLQLNPEFQRGHVWTRDQQISYMEFLLRGGRSGRDLYFNCPSWHHTVPEGAYNDYVCVDGLQRITAVLAFLNDEIPVFHSYYSEYEDSPRVIQDTLRVHVNDLKTYEEVLQWYIEMNAGGTPHTNAEIDRVQHLLQTEIASKKGPVVDKL